ncbi:hypothetical protein BROUX41_003462 [Berkeleyomyces rouxiae]
MEAIGAVANVVAVIDLSAKVGLLCFQYGKDVKNAATEIARLRKEVVSLQKITAQVQTVLESPNAQKLKDSKRLDDVLKQSHTQLTELDQRLKPKTTSKAMRRLGLRALKWPLQRGEVEGLVEGLRGYNQIISQILQVHQTEVINDINAKVDKTNQKLSSIDEKADDKESISFTK